MAKNEPDASNLRGTILNMAHSSGVNPSKEDVLNAAASSAIIGMIVLHEYRFQLHRSFYEMQRTLVNSSNLFSQTAFYRYEPVVG